ncbi:dienelactone hydrolase family protein [Hylemonella gracilis]|uniref:Dienelactone hydrolase family protein n=1 Tax=Hylemonella gracilis TaxID=80880 RepID=A0A4P6UPB6_9BURK|nr:dienelactone hydrolase family protein [Hylemonella gracilis]QBK06140.1 dienelactone hydrolase family protein [Hylemonella gracilis]
MLNTDLDSEFKSLLSVPTDPPGQSGASRRTVIKTALGVGYAASVLPIMAQTAITTSSAGLTAGEVTISAQGGFKLPAYRAQPAGKTGLPVVLVLSEIFGVHEHIADVARRFAHAGYLAIAPELFVRQGDAKSYTEIGKLMSEVIAKVPDAQVQSDLDATLAWAGANGGDLKRVGVTGFCWGGRQVWLYTAHNPAVKAGVAWYGRLVGAPSDLTPKQPVDVAGQLNGPVLGLYGEADTGIPQESIAQMKQALGAGNTNAKASQFVVYKDAPHAFHADYRPSYRKEAAEDGWKRALAWFKLNGVV